MAPLSSVAFTVISWNPEVFHDRFTTESGPSVVMLQFESRSDGFQLIIKSSLSSGVSSAVIRNCASVLSLILQTPLAISFSTKTPLDQNSISPMVGLTLRISSFFVIVTASPSSSVPTNVMSISPS